MSLIEKYDNLLVVQTFSKSRSMAGMRIGFAVGNAELIKYLNDVKYSFNSYTMSRAAISCGVESVKDDEYFKETTRKIIETREYTTKELEALGFEVLPSKANFVFAKSEKIDGGELYLKLKDKGVLVRHFTKERIKDFNRITIGTLEEMQILIEKIKEIMEAV
jgi:histidinol-phosphate aminotransferase